MATSAGASWGRATLDRHRSQHAAVLLVTAVEYREDVSVRAQSDMATRAVSCASSDHWSLRFWWGGSASTGIHSRAHVARILALKPHKPTAADARGVLDADASARSRLALTASFHVKHGWVAVRSARSSTAPWASSGRGVSSLRRAVSRRMRPHPGPDAPGSQSQSGVVTHRTASLPEASVATAS